MENTSKDSIKKSLARLKKQKRLQSKIADELALLKTNINQYLEEFNQTKK
jgi:hypothetical protein